MNKTSANETVYILLCINGRFWKQTHYSDVIMAATASQITSLTIVYSTIYSGADQRNLNAVESRHDGAQYNTPRLCIYVKLQDSI